MLQNNIQTDFFGQLSSGQVSSLYDYLHDILFFVKNKKGQFVKCNNTFAKRCGFNSENKILGKTDFDLFPEIHANTYVNDDNQVMKSQENIINKIELNTDSYGNTEWLLTTKVPLFSRNETVIGIAGTSKFYKKEDLHLSPFAEMVDVIRYIDSNYKKHIDIKDLAKFSSLSLSQFERRFKVFFQMTPSIYIFKVKINKACDLLLKNRLTITEIAFSLGFYDHSHFYKYFKKIVGVSPKAFKNKYKT